ncbi:MAG: hypothetical protein NT099_08675 [Candidatus Saganbacteria bacterium]|nr:hypothetical protein [Candidatus Saganbacteria bacterium]
MGRIQFRTAVDPRIPFRALTSAIPEKERQVLTTLKAKTGLDVEQLFDTGQTAWQSTYPGSKPLTVLFAQKKPSLGIPYIVSPQTEIRITIIDPNSSPQQEVGICQVTVSANGEIEGSYNSGLFGKNLRRGKEPGPEVTDIGIPALFWATTHCRPHGLQVLEGDQHKGTGFMGLFLCGFLATKVYGGSHLNVGVPKDSILFYAKAIGLEEKHLIKSGFSLRRLASALPVFDQAIDIPVATVTEHVFKRMEQLLAD